MQVIADETNPLSDDEHAQLMQYVEHLLKTDPSAPEQVQAVCIVTVVDKLATELEDAPQVKGGEVFLFMQNRLWRHTNPRVQAQYLKQVDGTQYEGPGLYPVTMAFDGLGRGRLDVVRIRAA